MAVFRFSRPEGSQVDPFNAGEPELPGGEPEALVGGDDPLPQADYAPHGEPGGTPHKPDDDYRAPTTHGHDYDAPSVDEPPARPRARSQRPRRARRAAAPTAGTREIGERTEKDRRILLRVVVVVVIALSFGASAVSCAAELIGSAVEGAGDAMESLGEAIFGGDDDASYDDGGDGDRYVPDQDADDRAAAAAFDERMDALLASPGEGPLFDLVSGYYEEKVLSVEGYSCAELGIDADELARFVIGGMRAEADYAFAFSDGTAYAYATFTTLNANELFWALDDAFGDYLLDRDLWGRDSGMPTDADREHVAGAVDEVLAGFDESESLTYTVDLVLADGTWVVDEDSLYETLGMALSLY